MKRESFKQPGLVIIILAAILSSACSEELPKVVELPRYDYRNATYLEIEKIEKTIPLPFSVSRLSS